VSVGDAAFPLISVIIPSYNYAAYLERRIESILNQTYPNIEIIVIDDCSPDNSVEVLQKYEAYPQITLIFSKKNKGWIATNNQGVNLAKGEIVLFAQCDDICEPTMVEKLYAAFQGNVSVGLSFCRSYLVNAAGDILGEDYDGRDAAFKHLCKTDVLILRKQLTSFLFNACVIPNLSAVLIRKACFETVGEFSQDYKVCSDWDWYFRVAAKYDVAYVASPLNSFMQHDTTIRSSTKERIIFEEYIRLLLSNLNLVELSFLERCAVRLRVMRLWSEHLISASLAGAVNFPYHFSRVVELDAWALIFLPVALALRIITLFRKVIGKVF